MGSQRDEIFEYIFGLSRIRKHWKRRQERKRNRIKQEGTAVSIAFEKILTIQMKYPKTAENRNRRWLSKKQGPYVLCNQTKLEALTGKREL